MIKQFLGICILLIVPAFIIAAIDDKPVVPADLQLRLRNVQLDSAKMQNINLQLVQQYQANLNQITHDSNEAQQIVDEIYKATKTDKTAYDFNPDTMAFTKKVVVEKKNN
jgi:hypothetical protein